MKAVIRSRKEEFFIRGFVTNTFLFVSFLLLSLFPTYVHAESTSIQQQIDDAEAGDTIHLTDGAYEESIVIHKPIHLVGSNDVTLIQNGEKPIITILANDVTIEQLKLDYKNSNCDSPAILVNGDNNSLNNLDIFTNSYGIKLDDAHDNTLFDISITGDKQASFNDRQHGIDVWKSNNNEIHHTRITDVKDGIYIESSNDTLVHHNYASHSRYGYHLMFTKHTTLENNESFENVSGMMIMGTNGTKASNNSLKYNQENVQSLGLLLFDVENATISNNDIANNRVGIFVENARHNEISMNNVQSNYIGLQFKEAENNRIFKNSFTANVVNGQAEKSSNNDTNKNYWGNHFGLDTTGDTISNLTYEVDPFFLNVTNEYPPFQLLFQSPGMIFLEQLLHTPAKERLIDQSPLMENPLILDSTESDNQLLIFLFSFSLFLISLIMITMGVKKNEKKI